MRSPIGPSNFHFVAGNSTPGHPPLTYRSTPKPSGLPLTNPTKNQPATVLANPGGALAALGKGLAAFFGRR